MRKEDWCRASGVEGGLGFRVWGLGRCLRRWGFRGGGVIEVRLGAYTPQGFFELRKSGWPR